jgi:hypothetical protein
LRKITTYVDSLPARRPQERERRPPKSTVHLVPEDSTDPIVADVFADIKATKKIDFVPAIWRALATHPQHLQICWTRLEESVLRFCTVVEQYRPELQ